MSSGPTDTSSWALSVALAAQPAPATVPVVEFDTHLPHVVTNPGPEVAEILNLFGPQGERAHVRTRSA